jgi:hypothetical protein
MAMKIVEMRIMLRGMSSSPLLPRELRHKPVALSESAASLSSLLIRRASVLSAHRELADQGSSSRRSSDAR